MSAKRREFMSSNKYLSAFLTSAAALGGLYLLDRFLGGEARANPKRYQHRKVFEEFTKEEKEDIVRKYAKENRSALSLAKEFGTSQKTLRQILEDQKCEIRDSAKASDLALRLELTDDQKKVIRDLWCEEDAGHSPTIKSIFEATGFSEYIITRFLVEEGLFKTKTTQELSFKDKEKLVKEKEAANRDGRKLIFRTLGKDLSLDHRDVSRVVLLRFFAERGLNRDWDYTSSFPVEKQERILSYFKGGEQTHSLKDIADIERVAKGPLQQFLYSHNIIPRSAGSFNKVELEEEQRNEIIKLLEEGNTNWEIATLMELPSHQIASFINEYRASQERTESRLLESMHAIRARLESRDPKIVEFIMAERAKTPPTSYKNIEEKLRTEKGVNMAYTTVRNVHLEELSKRK